MTAPTIGASLAAPGALPCTAWPDLFFPEGPMGRPSRSGPRVEKAKRLCWECPIRSDCLAQGMSEPLGIWGGLTPVERRGLARTTKLRRQAAFAVDWTFVQQLIVGNRCEVPAENQDETIKALRAAGLPTHWIVHTTHTPYAHVRRVITALETLDMAA